MTLVSAAALLIDLDGTLVDSGDHVEQAWRIFAQAHDLDPETFLERAHGRRTKEVIYEVAPQLDVTASTIEVEGILADLGAVLTPGAGELVDVLPRHSWAIVTSSTAKLAGTRFRAPTSLREPQVLVTAEAVSTGKPDPAGYLLAAMMLGVDPRECIVIEDAPAGVEAGKAAGMTVIGVLTTHTAADLAAADYLVADPAGITVVSSNRGEPLKLELAVES